MKKFCLLFVIILIAAFFRLYWLSSVPPHPSLDEVTIGYNAFSILKTGADEYGTKFPILLRAYDDWRPALYVYLVVPFVKLFGLNVLAVRLPSAILSILTVLTSYFLVKELFSKKEKEFAEILSFTTAFFLAVSPWHIYISRLGHEVNGGLAFFIFGFYFFLKYINAQKPKAIMLLVSSIFFALSFDFYQSTKIFIPLFLLSLAIISRNKLLQYKKNLITAIFVGFFITLPIIVQGLTPNGLIRFNATSIVVANPQVTADSARKLLVDKEKHNYLGLLVDNRRAGYGILMAEAYVSHFNPYWLFGNSGKDMFKAPGFGLLYLFELPLILLGIVTLLKTKTVRFALSCWALAAILPAALTTDAPHAMRIFNILPLPQMLGAFGFAYLFELITKQKRMVQLSALALFILLIGLQVFTFYNSYFNELPKKLGNQFSYGVLQALETTKQLDKNYSKIIVSNQGVLADSYMFYLFSTKFDPESYQKAGGTASGGFASTHVIGKYHFLNPASGRQSEPETLYVLSPKDIILGTRIISKVKFKDGTDSIIISENK